MIDTVLLDECRRLALAVAPELADRPIYLCDSSTFDGLPVHHGCLGWAMDGSRVIFDMKDRIGDRWEGPGPIIALEGDGIRAEFPDKFRDGVLQTVLHEVAHIVPLPPMPTAEVVAKLDVPEMRKWQLNRLAEAITAPAPTAGDPDDCHNLNYIRRASHLYFRSAAAGWSLPSNGLFGGACWFCSWPIHYMQELLPELIRLRDATFAEIEATDPPIGFVELWRSNLAFYRSFLAEPV